MKRFIIGLVIVGLLVGGYFWIRKHGVASFSFLEGETTRVKRGDLEVPITASGRIEPASITQIKGKASGEIVEIPFQEGEMVTKNALIIRLKKIDEQRNVDRAQADYERAKIAHARAEAALEEARDTGVRLAQAELDQAEARLSVTQVAFNIKDRLRKESQAPDARISLLTQEEFDEVEARLREAKATRDAAAARLDRAKKPAIDFASMDVDTAEQNRKAAEQTLEDAKERLRETEVLSPIDGMILKRHVELGEVIQSGRTSLTGGTILMEIADVSEIYAVVNVDEADIGLVRELAPEEARPGPPEARPAGGGEDADAKPTGKPGAGDSEEGEIEGVPASQLVELPEGVIDQSQTVEVTVESFPDTVFRGVIERIAPQADTAQAIATFKVWVRLTSENKHLLVGLLNLQAEAHFTAKSVTDALLVSYDAFQKDPNGEEFGVYVPVHNPKPGDKKYRFVPCKFGVDNGIDVQVISGLKEGDVVYTKLPIQAGKGEGDDEEDED